MRTVMAVVDLLRLLFGRKGFRCTVLMPGQHLPKQVVGRQVVILINLDD